MFWDIEVGGDEQRNEDVKVALKWMQGTDIQRQLIPLKDVKIFFHEIVVPAMTSASTKPSLHAFYRAFSLVSSRAFIVDAYHGLAMVPVADAFNHIRDNQVHLESAFDVCPDCGSLRQCIHDRENERNEFEPTSLSTEEDEEELYYTMATTTYIPMGIGGTRTRTEIFNTYGSHLSNAQLLNQYGFILDANEADFISFDVEGVLRVLEVRTEMDVRKVWMERLNGVKEEVGETEVLYVSEKASDLRINSDGRITIGLFFLLCVAVGVVDDQGLKQLLEAGGSEGERGDHGQEIAPLARSIVTLCEHRLGELTQDDVGEMLDDISPSYWRTRTVGMHVMAEQAMLRSCISYWEEYLPE
ncbi:hypothetical protein V5O48_001977 [Marasmius crinis-equi]|uniref:SET domain-containing protein n=1 Tax=Marasmius crinis-equi TaxID=585013 RepID=A0ABR3FWZ1_9AGAR